MPILVINIEYERLWGPKKEPTKEELTNMYFTTTCTKIDSSVGEVTADLTMSPYKSTTSAVAYSIDDGKTWISMDMENEDSITVHLDLTSLRIGDSVSILWKGISTNYFGNTMSSPLPLVPTGTSMCSEWSVSGNIMSLLYGDDFKDKTEFPPTSVGTFMDFFNGFRDSNFPLVDAGNLILPATTLVKNCYCAMFSECKDLKSAPELPATTLVEGCYYQMFYNCTALTTAPLLPATTLAKTCYNGMFKGCTALTDAPELPATTLAQNCYQEMFYGCTALTNAPSLTGTALATGCYYQMFYNCTALTTAPSLPATTLSVNSCYYEMFYGCTALNNVTMLATVITGSYCLSNWLKNVSETGTFTKADSMDSLPSGNSGIPANWTVVNFATH